MFGKNKKAVEPKKQDEIIIDSQIVSVSYLRKQAKKASRKFWGLLVSIVLVSSLVLPYLSLASVSATNSDVFVGTVLPGYSMGGIKISAYGIDLNSWAKVEQDKFVVTNYGIWNSNRLGAGNDATKNFIEANSSNKTITGNDKSNIWKALTESSNYTNSTPNGVKDGNTQYQSDYVMPYRTVSDYNYWDSQVPQSTSNTSSAAITVSLYPDFVVLAKDAEENAAIVTNPDSVVSDNGQAFNVTESGIAGTTSKPYYISLKTLFNAFDLNDPEDTFDDLLQAIADEAKGNGGKSPTLNSLLDDETADANDLLAINSSTYTCLNNGLISEEDKTTNAFNPYPYSMVFQQTDEDKGGIVTSSIYGNEEAYVFFSPASVYTNYINLQSEMNNIIRVSSEDVEKNDPIKAIQLGYYMAAMAIMEAYLEESLPQDMTRGYVGPTEPANVTTDKNPIGNSPSATDLTKVSYGTLMYDIAKNLSDGADYDLGKTNAIMDTLSVFGYNTSGGDSSGGGENLTPGVMKGMNRYNAYARNTSLTPYNNDGTKGIVGAPEVNKKTNELDTTSSGFYTPLYFPIQQHRMPDMEKTYRFSILSVLPYETMINHIRDWQFEGSTELMYSKEAMASFKSLSDIKEGIAGLAGVYDGLDETGNPLSQFDVNSSIVISPDTAAVAENSGGEDNVEEEKGEEVAISSSTTTVTDRVDAALLAYNASSLTADNVHDLIDICRSVRGIKYETFYRYYNPLKSAGGDQDFFITRVSPADTTYFPSILLNGYKSAGGDEVNTTTATENCSFDYFSIPSFAPCFASHSASDCYYGSLSYELRAFYTAGFIKTLSTKTGIPRVEQYNQAKEQVDELQNQEVLEGVTLKRNLVTLYVMGKRLAYIQAMNVIGEPGTTVDGTDIYNYITSHNGWTYSSGANQTIVEMNESSVALNSGWGYDSGTENDGAPNQDLACWRNISPDDICNNLGDNGDKASSQDRIVNNDKLCWAINTNQPGLSILEEDANNRRPIHSEYNNKNTRSSDIDLFENGADTGRDDAWSMGGYWWSGQSDLKSKIPDGYGELKDWFVLPGTDTGRKWQLVLKINHSGDGIHVGEDTKEYRSIDTRFDDPANMKFGSFFGDDVFFHSGGEVSEVSAYDANGYVTNNLIPNKDEYKFGGFLEGNTEGNPFEENNDVQAWVIAYSVDPNPDTEHGDKGYRYAAMDASIWISAVYNYFFKQFFGENGKYYWLPSYEIGAWVGNNEVVPVIDEESGAFYKGEEHQYTVGFNGGLAFLSDKTFADQGIIKAYEEQMAKATEEIQTAVGNLVQDYNLLTSAMPSQMQNCIAWADYQNATDSEGQYQSDPSESNVVVSLNQNINTGTATENTGGHYLSAADVEDAGATFVADQEDPKIIAGGSDTGLTSIGYRIVRGVEGATWTSTTQPACYTMSATIGRIEKLASTSGSGTSYPYYGIAQGRLESGTDQYALMQAHVIDYTSIASGIAGDLSSRIRSQVVAITNPEYTGLPDFTDILGLISGIFTEFASGLLHLTGDAFEGMMFNNANSGGSDINIDNPSGAAGFYTDTSMPMILASHTTTPYMSRTSAADSSFNTVSGEFSAAAPIASADLSGIEQAGSEGLLYVGGGSFYAALQTIGLALVMLFLLIIAFSNFYAYTSGSQDKIITASTNLKVVLPRAIVAVFMIGLPPIGGGAGFQGGAYLLLQFISGLIGAITQVFAPLGSSSIISAWLSMSTSYLNGGLEDIATIITMAICVIVVAIMFIIGTLCIILQGLLLLVFYLFGPIVWAFFVWPFGSGESKSSKEEGVKSRISEITQHLKFGPITNNKAGSEAATGWVAGYISTALLSVAWGLIFWLLTMIFTSGTSSSAAAAGANAALLNTGSYSASSSIANAALLSIAGYEFGFVNILLATALAVVAFILMLKLFTWLFQDNMMNVTGLASRMGSGIINGTRNLMRDFKQNYDNSRDSNKTRRESFKDALYKNKIDEFNKKRSDAAAKKAKMSELDANGKLTAEAEQARKEARTARRDARSNAIGGIAKSVRQAGRDIKDFANGDTSIMDIADRHAAGGRIAARQAEIDAKQEEANKRNKIMENALRLHEMSDEDRKKAIANLSDEDRQLLQEAGVLKGNQLADYDTLSSIYNKAAEEKNALDADIQERQFRLDNQRRIMARTNPGSKDDQRKQEILKNYEALGKNQQVGAGKDYAYGGRLESIKQKMRDEDALLNAKNEQDRNKILNGKTAAGDNKFNRITDNVTKSARISAQKAAKENAAANADFDRAIKANNRVLAQAAPTFMQLSDNLNQISQGEPLSSDQMNQHVAELYNSLTSLQLSGNTTDQVQARCSLLQDAYMGGVNLTEAEAAQLAEKVANNTATFEEQKQLIGWRVQRQIMGLSDGTLFTPLATKSASTPALKLEGKEINDQLAQALITTMNKELIQGFSTATSKACNEMSQNLKDEVGNILSQKMTYEQAVKEIANVKDHTTNVADIKALEKLANELAETRDKNITEERIIQVAHAQGENAVTAVHQQYEAGIQSLASQGKLTPESHMAILTREAETQIASLNAFDLPTDVVLSSINPNGIPVPTKEEYNLLQEKISNAVPLNQAETEKMLVFLSYDRYSKGVIARQSEANNTIKRITESEAAQAAHDIIAMARDNGISESAPRVMAAKNMLAGIEYNKLSMEQAAVVYYDKMPDNIQGDHHVVTQARDAWENNVLPRLQPGSSVGDVMQTITTMVETSEIDPVVGATLTETLTNIHDKELEGELGNAISKKVAEHYPDAVIARQPQEIENQLSIFTEQTAAYEILHSQEGAELQEILTGCGIDEELSAAMFTDWKGDPDNFNVEKYRYKTNDIDAEISKATGRGDREAVKKLEAERRRRNEANTQMSKQASRILGAFEASKEMLFNNEVQQKQSNISKKLNSKAAPKLGSKRP